MRAPWPPETLFEQDTPIRDRERHIEAARAISHAADELERRDTVMILDLRTGLQTSFVGVPVTMHVHGQDCGRA